ncbi:hypothetical protein [Chachezhania sediminis]|uniref:hypothetical protein n=1 Tax=Chachezhania sediminis TaxID=2599291 RepID=UPI00131CE004|nr:hypothetical protein [Chachezhania sediminis]
MTRRKGRKTKLLLGLLGLGALAGCGPVSVYYQQGVSGTRTVDDINACQVSALKDAPAAMQVRQLPPVFWPGYTQCYPNGAGGQNCYTTPGYWVDGGVETYDPNAPLRSRLTDQCMMKRGYAPLSLPRCSDAVRASVPPALNDKMPPITSSSCVVLYGNGYWRIVTPGA